MRFERDDGSGYESVFPEVFSFHAERHDPAELYLRLEDLWTNPARLGPGAGRRDAEELILRLLAQLPITLEEVFDRFAAEGGTAHVRVAEDVAVFSQIVLRFLEDKGLSQNPRLPFCQVHFRKLRLHSLSALVAARVSPDFLADYVRGEAKAEVPADPTDLSFFYALAAGEAEPIDRQLVGAAERAYHGWLEDVCLDEERRAFETAQSPFDERAVEVRRAVSASGAAAIERGRDLSPFLRRPHDRDCLRLLGKLETWFLREYDVRHAAITRYHAENLRVGVDDADRVLTMHGTRNYTLALLLPALPFLGAVFVYSRAPVFFDVAVSALVVTVLAVAVWFLAFRFMWKKDLTFFHTSVPRIGAGIIVGYLPVFLIDEVWDLAEQPPEYLFAAIAMLGSTTLLYLFVEVQRRLGDGQLAFARARDIFMLGLIEAAGFGIVVTGLLGPLMATRNWGPDAPQDSLLALRGQLEPFAGELPRIMGYEPLVAFPTAVLLMSFLAFFIGTFLQLLWEDLAITEPL